MKAPFLTLSSFLIASPLANAANANVPAYWQERPPIAPGRTSISNIRGFQEFYFSDSYQVRLISVGSAQNGVLFVELSLGRNGEAKPTLKKTFLAIDGFQNTPYGSSISHSLRGAEFAMSNCYNDRGTTDRVDGFDCFQVYQQVGGPTSRQYLKQKLRLSGVDEYFVGTGSADGVKLYLESDVNGPRNF